MARDDDQYLVVYVLHTTFLTASLHIMVTG